jgi:tRNA-splicing ligase RtcB
VARGVPKGYEWLSIDSELGREYMAAMEAMGAYALANHQLIHRHFAASAGLEARFQLWNRHNYAWVNEESGEVIHRKGATPAELGVRGIIPGTSGTSSYLVEGLGNEESILSSSHGAGRYHSRTEAKRRHDAKAFARHMERQDILHLGLAPDETYQAYKDIETVMALQDGVLVRRLARLTPKVVLMGGESDDGD